MTLRPIQPGLRTIHNGSAFVAKANIIVPPNGELTVPEVVAKQLQRDGAFKDGPAPDLPAGVALDQVAEYAADGDIKLGDLDAVAGPLADLVSESATSDDVAPKSSKTRRKA